MYPFIKKLRLAHDYVKYKRREILMTRIIEAVFEDGVFKPCGKVSLKEHQKIKIILSDETETAQEPGCTLSGIIDIAADCADTDLSTRHNEHLYGSHQK